MRIKELELQTGNLATVEAFYTGVLQLPLLQRQPQRLTFGVGYSKLHFVEVLPSPGAYHFAFLIPPNLLLPSYEWIIGKTSVLPFNENEALADFKNWNAKAFYFHDGEGNILELIAHYDLEESSETEFTPSAISGIGEVGLAVNSVEDTCGLLHHTYNIPYYSKGPCTQNFAAMGEEEALLIVSHKERGWIPTGQLPNKHTVRFRLELNGNTIYIVL